MNRWILRASVAAVSAVLLAGPGTAVNVVRADGPAVAPAAPVDPVAASAQATCDKAFDFLKSKQQKDFSWQSKPYEPIGMTALVLKAFMSDPKWDPDTDFLDKSFDKLKSYQLENGGIYTDTLACYNTAIAISAMAASHDHDNDAAIDKAMHYLRTLQWSDKIEGVGDTLKVGEADPKYGGFGYGAKGGRPDLSNTQMAIDALHDAGVKPDDPAYQAALKFASRCQNVSESNDQPWAGNDGGFVYSPANNGMSDAGEYPGPDGKRLLRSYGSMTYAGFKSLIYAGLSHDDPRVKAAWAWVSKNYSMDENPGMGATDPTAAQGGLYYYYDTMARALAAYGEPIITDAQGNKHDWRVDMIKKIATLQKPDGSFVGEKKWMEDNAVITTSYVVVALETAKKDLKDHPAK